MVCLAEKLLGSVKLVQARLFAASAARPGGWYHADSTQIASARLTATGATACPTSLRICRFQPTVALIAGILILITPRFLNVIIALYLIIVGASGLGVIK
jgi:hypothetical protein